nr:uncharacterized protein LOC128686800 isoform X1 [Cherax quadricarinatus]
MAETDHGELLTKFEEIFGTVVEHEVIKMILQSCGWESKSASEMLLAMIDPKDLPLHAQNILLADSIVQNSAKQLSDKLSSDDSSLVQTLNVTSGQLEKDLINHTNRPRSPVSNENEFSILNPSLASGTVLHPRNGNARVFREDDNAAAVIRTETEISSPHNSFGGIGSGSSSPLSPHRFGFAVDFEINRERDTSNWVLAPEFVPNAFNPNPSANNNGIWPLEMSHFLMQTPQNPKGKSKVKDNVSKKDDIVKKILIGTKIMVLMRGLPGSGKSTLAKEIKGKNGVILSTDDFFFSKKGKYNYDPSRISEAHQWNKHRAAQRLQDGKTPIIIDNTNLQAWEMKPYVKLALQYGYEVDILDADAPWKNNLKELAKRNTHGVPKSKILEMKGRYEREINIEHIIADLRGFQINKQKSADKDPLVYEFKSEEDDQTLFQQNINGGQITENAFSKFQDDFQKIEDWSSDADDDDDDVDVIIEGYDSEEEKADCVGNLDTDGKTEVSEAMSGNEIQADSKLDEGKFSSHVCGIATQGKIKNIQDKRLYQSGESMKISIKNEDMEWADVSDEEKIQRLIEEANADIDIAQSERDWFDLTSQSNEEEDVSDQKFSDLVMSFGSIVRAQIEKSASGISTGAEIGTATFQTADTLNEDLAMYELCSNVEEKTGKSLSMLLTRSGENEAMNFLSLNSSYDFSKNQENEADSLFSFISLREATSNVMNDISVKNNDVGVIESAINDGKNNDVRVIESAVTDGKNNDVEMIESAVNDGKNNDVGVIESAVNDGKNDDVGVIESAVNDGKNNDVGVIESAVNDGKNNDVGVIESAVNDGKNNDVGVIGSAVNDGIKLGSFIDNNDVSSNTRLESENHKIVMLEKNYDNSEADFQKHTSDEAVEDLESNDRHISDKILMEGKILETNDAVINEENILLIRTVVSENNKLEDFISKTINSPQDIGYHYSVADSLASWECVDTFAGESSVNWDSSEKVETNKSVSQSSKPSRSRRKRISGDPDRWLGDTNEETNKVEDPSIVSWKPVQSGIPSWDSNNSPILSDSDRPLKQEIQEIKSENSLKPQPHTGAVPKFRRHKQHARTLSAASTSSGNSDDQTSNDTTSYPLPCIEKSLHDAEKSSRIKYIPAETQTLSIDFEALQLDNNLYELKIMYGQPGYITKYDSDVLPDSGPLTRGKLYLDKSTMTDYSADITMVESYRNLVAFFPNISEDDLQDVLEKCMYNLDWAMNVLLDGGYEMSDPADASISYEEPKEVDIDTESTTETTSTGDGREDPSSFADASDISSDVYVEEKSRKFKQSQQPKDLASKKAIEQAFTFNDSVDDRVTRLTGKDVSELNMMRVKEMKAKRKQGERKIASNRNEKPIEESTSGDDAEGAQYITLVMDPLFASQLTRMFGPVGACEISGELTPEDRSVILPLEFCLMIHKYWTLTLDGKFKHETEVLDSLIREDESLARRLQEEEEVSLRNGKNEKMEEVFQNDPPSQFKEIMDLEQALQHSHEDSQSSDCLTMSSHLTLQRLYAEYPKVDPNALKEEFARSGFSYQDTVEKLYRQYGTEHGTPKTVIAPEALYRYEQQMIRQAQRDSLAQQEIEDLLTTQENEDELFPDDPQVYRNEAQLHYHQRQEAFKKAQEASSQGMKAVAAYYARLGNLHSTKLGEANQRASKKILEATNANRTDANCLDLHLLHVPEALSAAQAFLKERQRVLTARGIKQMQVSLITGRGAHSVGGQARLKPAIKEFLQKSKFLFHEANSGMFTVTLQS